MSEETAAVTVPAVHRWRAALVTAAVLRYAVPIAALPLIPVLVPDRVALLTLLRPGKEILLLGGGLSTTTGSPGILLAFLAYLPLMVGGVWVFFGVGRVYGPRLAAGTAPRWLQRAVPADGFVLAQRVLTRRGPTVAVLGRLAALPPTVVAAAAGASDVSTRRFLVADLVGAIAAFGATFGVGLLLGNAYEQGGPWLTAASVAVLVVAVIVLTRWLRAEAGRSSDPA